MIRIDARGMRCPWPALRLGRALRTHGDEPIELLADDPAAERECRAVATAAGRSLITLETGLFHVGSPSPVNTLFTGAL